MLVSEIYVNTPKYWPPSARTEHVPFAFWIMEALKPRVYVALGVHDGMSYFACCQIADENQFGTRCYAVDGWQGDAHAGSCSDEIFKQVAQHNEENYSAFSELLRMKFRQALEYIPDGSIDLLQIDGRGLYDDVKSDFVSWIPKLSERAVVVFHDTEVLEKDFGVWKLWAELESRFPSFSFSQGRGLGVIAFGPEIDPGLTEFFALSASPDATRRFREIFAACGKSLRDQSDWRAHLAGVQGELSTAKENLTKLGAQNVELLNSLYDADTKRVSADAVIADLKAQLTRSREKPLRILADYFKFRLLKRLTKSGLPLSPRTTQRLKKSAAKRDPRRALFDPEQLPAGQIEQADEPQSGALVRHNASRVEGAILALNLANASSKKYNASKKTIMIVSHEASRTGAPILGLNLSNELSNKYNVINLILEDGELREDFLSAGVLLLEADRRTMDAEKISLVVDRICSQHVIAYALVNSIESRAVLPALKARGVPSVMLLHEFAANIRPINAFPEVFRFADQVVFSTRVTLENALQVLRIERNGPIHVIPQGKCLVPVREMDPDVVNSERLWLDKILRPAGEKDHEFVVIGGGSLEMRKGLDLFVECANRVINTNGGGRFRFVWIGNGYKPETDTVISVYLADQIKRAGLGTQVNIVRATSQIEHAYASADLLLISSRLDPLPNVAIDALITGIPVVCFDRTTGIADFLIEAGLGGPCVARYLDSSDMSGKVLALASNDELRADVARRGQSAAVAAFDFGRYVERLDRIASRELSCSEQAEQDMAVIIASGAFRADFYSPPDRADKSEKEQVADYLDSNRLGGIMRRPMPGFHPGLFAAHHGASSGADPFAQFLKEGRPAGPWSCPVLDNTRPIGRQDSGRFRTAIHLHVFYPETLPEILSRLGENTCAPDLFVSAPSAVLEALKDAFRVYKGRVVDIQAVPNRGRDIGPLLTTFGRRLVSEYDVIGHFHTKKSPHVSDRTMIEIWSSFLLENMLGGPKGGPMLDRVLAEMAADPNIGIAYPDDPHVISWTENRGAAENLALRMGLGLLPEQFSFPVGTMFWMRSSVLERFVALNLTWEDYPAEPLPIDGTMLHAIERLFGIVPEHDGKRSLVTNVRGVTR